MLKAHVGCLVDTDQAMSQLEHVVSERNDDAALSAPFIHLSGAYSQLRGLRLGLDVVGHNGHVLEVERGVNFVLQGVSVLISTGGEGSDSP